MLKYCSCVLLLLFCSATLASTPLQPLEQGQEIPQPDWFKDSFLELADDLEEAADEGKELVLYFHQQGCPYCYNLITQIFADPEVSQYMQERYHLIALNLWGDRVVILPDGSEMSEKDLAVALRIQYTPTLLFLNGEGTPKLRLDGYRHKQQFMQQLAVLNGQSARPVPQSSGSQGALTLAIETGQQPLAIQFITDQCESCREFERDILSRGQTRELLQQFQLLQINLSLNPLLHLPDGRLIQARQWARELGISGYPAWLMLDNSGQEQFRIDAYVRAFHFNSALEYVAGEHYKTQPEFQRFINERGDRLRAQGQHVDILQ